MMHRTIFLSVWLAMSTGGTMAQSFLSPNLFSSLRMAYNPALSGSQGSPSFFLLHRADAYWKYSFVQADLHIPCYSLSVGIVGDSYQSLLENHGSLHLNLAYRVKTKNGFFQFGLAPGLQQFKLHTNNLTILNQEDYLMPTGTHKACFNIHTGILYKAKRVSASLYARNVIKQSRREYSLPLPIYALWTSYSFSLGKEWYYTPSLYGQTNQENAQAWFGNQLSYKQVGVGVQLGHPTSWAAGFAISLPQNQFKLHLGYVTSSRNLGIARIFVHEVQVGLDLETRKKKNGTPKSLKEIPYQSSPLFF